MFFNELYQNELAVNEANIPNVPSKCNNNIDNICYDG